ncbi:MULTISPECIES: EF-P 5-aminopentanol modification-associated protein YfmF [Robertmurraya]|uniref:EF-P 5-aminopentanol modification-associated protein YfmF n=1 Tax=Robertmurraya beringensis TaxID=641660 RepID=A0ABV6KMX2_9BACI
MAVVSETIKELSGFKLHMVKTDKFKTNTIIFKMKAPLQKETVTKRALLPNVLQSNSKKFPTTGKLRGYLDELYGATFYIDLGKKGEYHTISFAMEVANERFLSDPTPLLKTAIDFLVEVLTNPNADGGEFHKETLEKEKRSLKQRIQSIYDDKMKYSNNRLIEEMCKEEPYSLHVHGKESEVDSINGKDLYDYYQKALAEDELSLYIIGDIEEQEVEQMVNERFTFSSRTPHALEKKQPAQVEENVIKEEQDVKQGKLNIGYRTNVTYGDPDYFALQVFNGVYGGFSHSKLFINVREKASLAYYAASRVESHKGLLMVMSGIDNSNFEKAVSIIKEQMQAMKNGDFSDEDLIQTKAVIKNQLLETLDTARGIVEILYHNVVAGQQIQLDEWLQRIDAVTKEEVVQVANKIQLDTIYFLTGTGATK